MGMVYTGGGYDAVKTLANAWTEVGDPSNFDVVGDAIRGINGLYKIDPETNSGVSFPNMTDDPEGGRRICSFRCRTTSIQLLRQRSSFRLRSDWHPECRTKSRNTSCFLGAKVSV